MTFPMWPGNGTIFLRDFLFFSWAMVYRDHVLGHGALAMGVVIVGGKIKIPGYIQWSKIYVYLSIHINYIIDLPFFPVLPCLKNKRKKKINLLEWKYNFQNKAWSTIWKHPYFVSKCPIFLRIKSFCKFLNSVRPVKSNVYITQFLVQKKLR